MEFGLSLFGKKRRAKKSPGRKPKRGHGVRKLPKSMAYVVVRGRKRKLHRGANGGLYYRTKSGRNYVPAAVLRRKGHVLAKKALKRRQVRRAKKQVRKGRKLKMTKKAIAARKAYKKRMARKSRFGLF
jgi:hypothetical protein